MTPCCFRRFPRAPMLQERKSSRSFSNCLRLAGKVLKVGEFGRRGDRSEIVVRPQPSKTCEVKLDAQYFSQARPLLISLNGEFLKVDDGSPISIAPGDRPIAIGLQHRDVRSPRQLGISGRFSKPGVWPVAHNRRLRMRAGRSSKPGARLKTRAGRGPVPLRARARLASRRRGR